MKRNAAAQHEDAKSMLNFTRELIYLRKEYCALRRGEFVPLSIQRQDHISFLRRQPGQTILVALNFKDLPTRVALPQTIIRRPWKVLLSTHRSEAPDVARDGLELGPYEVCLLMNS